MILQWLLCTGQTWFILNPPEVIFTWRANNNPLALPGVISPTTTTHTSSSWFIVFKYVLPYYNLQKNTNNPLLQYFRSPFNLNHSDLSSIVRIQGLAWLSICQFLCFISFCPPYEWTDPVFVLIFLENELLLVLAILKQEATYCLLITESFYIVLCTI